MSHLLPVVLLVYLFTAHVQQNCTVLQYCRYIKNDDHHERTTVEIPSFLLNGISFVVGVRPFFRTVLHTTTVLYVGFFFENSFHLTRRSYCLPGLIVFLCTPPPCAFEFEMSRTRLLLFIALLSFAFALEMPCRRTPEAAERDRARKRRKRADQSVQRIVHESIISVASAMLKKGLCKHHRSESRVMCVVASYELRWTLKSVKR